VRSRGWAHLATTYDVVATDYAEAFSDELDAKPFDRELLERFAEQHRGRAIVADLGCGPGQIGAYLADHGCRTLGVDLSIGMVRSARKYHPDCAFHVGDLRALPVADGVLDAVVCFYAVIHLPRQQVPTSLAEMARVLKPAGRLLLAVHEGQGELHVDDWFGRGVSVDVTLFGRSELVRLLSDAGFSEITAMRRRPYEGEHQTQRLYLLATRSA
jgi:SAM-dependent methyltransferase